MGVGYERFRIINNVIVGCDVDGCSLCLWANDALMTLKISSYF
jgi:hypothetical protein